VSLPILGEFRWTSVSSDRGELEEFGFEYESAKLDTQDFECAYK
jgi:hypothetical protein